MFVPKGKGDLQLKRVEIADLRPTQITIGKIAAKNKADKLGRMKNEFELVDFMRSHPIPAVIGPHNKYFITDHHHLCHAATQQDIKYAYVIIEGDYSYMTKKDFWKALQGKQWAYPVDEDGTLHEVDKIPKKFEDLKDDPYRSVATFVRDSGSFDKTPTAFAEFKWAEFFRKHIPIEMIQDNFNKAVAFGCSLAHDPSASELPGYINKEEL